MICEEEVWEACVAGGRIQGCRWGILRNWFLFSSSSSSCSSSQTRSKPRNWPPSASPRIISWRCHRASQAPQIAAPLTQQRALSAAAIIFPVDFRDGDKNPTPQQLEQPDVQFEPAVKRLSNCLLGTFLLLGVCLQGPENHPHCPVSEQNILF